MQTRFSNVNLPVIDKPVIVAVRIDGEMEEHVGVVRDLIQGAGPERITTAKVELITPKTCVLEFGLSEIKPIKYDS